MKITDDSYKINARLLQAVTIGQKIAFVPVNNTYHLGTTSSRTVFNNIRKDSIITAGIYN